MHPGDGRTYRDVEDIPGHIYRHPPIYKVGIKYNVFVINHHSAPNYTGDFRRVA
jgi:hypothetical protein